ncbi:MAG: GTPase [Candidatus Micrarchaeota archaeon]
MSKYKPTKEKIHRVHQRKPNKWARFRDMLKHCEIVLEVLDARDPEGTRTPILEHWAGRDRIIKIVNKSDLMFQKNLDPNEYFLFSAKYCTTKKRQELIQRILNKREIRPIRVVIVGYPNVGKSSLINILAKKKVARTAPISGTTTNVQWIRIHPEIMLLDTPGVFSAKQSQYELLMKGALNVTSIKDPETFAIEFLEIAMRDPEKRRKMETLFDIRISEADTPSEIIEKIAKRRGFVSKGGTPNLDTAIVTFLRKLSETGL